MVWGIFKSDSVSEAYKKMKAEELKGDQHKLDVNKNGKVDGEDLAKLRAQKEEVENVEEGWDDMLKYAKEKNGPQPNGGAGKKQGTRYGGSKQKEEKPVKEEAESVEEAVGTSAKYADKKGFEGGKYTATDRMLDMKNYDKVRAQRLAQKKAEHEKQDPKTAKAGYAKHMVDTHKAEKKAAKRGVDASHLNWKHRNGVVSGKLPEDYTEQDLDTLINEVLSKDASAGEWISDFVHSDNPKFAGKSKEKRKEMALAAYYGAQENESTDYESFIELDEEADLVKSGSKQIKHANVKDKQDDQDTMEPRAQGERDFLDKLSVNITDDPAKDGVNTGASKVSHASEPKGQGAGKYDAKEKLGKQGVKEAADCGSETKGKKTFRKFKAETRS